MIRPLAIVAVLVVGGCACEERCYEYTFDPKYSSGSCNGHIDTYSDSRWICRCSQREGDAGK